MKPVVFLDMDGVLHNRRSQMLARFGWHPRGFYGKTRAVDWECVRRLREVVEDCGLDIVVSSVWRDFGWVTPKDNTVIKALRWAGWQNPPIIDRTTTTYGPRGRQIAQWLQEHPEVPRFVIVDDDSYDIFQKDALARTTFKYGLEDKDARRMRRILASDHGINPFRQVDAAPADG